MLVRPHLILISIPSGAIKRKQGGELNDRAKKIISIPSGAIKRTLSEMSSVISENFNSFWCD